MGREIPAPGPSTRIQPPLKYGSNLEFVYPPREVRKKKKAARVLRFVEALSADEGGFAIAIHAAVVISDE